MAVWINGVRSDSETVSVHDAGFLRGDGCFEALRSYAGRPFAVTEHIERLQRSAAALDIALPGFDELAHWIEQAAQLAGHGIVRVVATRGGADPTVAPPVVIVITEPLPVRMTETSLQPIQAPWHAAGRDWQLASAKTLSYGPNVNTSRTARTLGFDDALLVSDEDLILEGPTFTIGWVVDGVVETPDLDLFILDSITRRYVIKYADQVTEGRFPLSRLGEASEVFAMSTLKEVLPVVRVGDLAFDPGPVASELGARFRAGLEADGFEASAD